MKRYLFAVPALCLAAFPAMADGFSYNYVQAGWETVDLDVSGGSDVDGDGFGVGGSFEVGDDFFIGASYGKADFDGGVDLTALQVGFGWHTGLSDKTDFVASLSYVEGEVDAPGFGSFDDSGYGASIGVRSNVSDAVELFGAISYVDYGDGGDSTGIGGGFWYNLNETFSLGMNIATDDDVTSWGAGVRVYFNQ